MANISRIKLDETTYEIKDAQAARASDLALKQDALTAGNGIAIDNSDIIRTTGIPFGTCDSTSTSKVFTATVPGIYKLEDGVCCIIKNGVVTSESGFTLNVNGLGAKPSYSNMATGNDVTPTEPTRDTTIFNINYAMLFIYSSTIVDGGGWICYRGYDANTNTIGYQVRSNSQSLPASQKFYRYRLLFTSADGTHYVPANTSSSTNATSSRTVNQTPIDPFGHITYYGTTAAVEANARPAASSLWIIYTLNLGYSFNRTGAALTLSSWAPVYVKCAPQSNGSAIIDADNPYVQALPTTNDGKIYIFLGIAYSATSIELLNNHPVYYHDGTGIKLWMGGAIPSQSDIDAAKPFIITVTETTSGNNTTYSANKTFAEITTAITDGREIRAFKDGQCYNLSYYDNQIIEFDYIDSETLYCQQIEINSSNHIIVFTRDLQSLLTFDNVPTANSNNPVKSGGVHSALANKADKTLFGVITASYDNEGRVTGYTCDKTYSELYNAIINGTQVLLYEGDEWGCYLYPTDVSDGLSFKSFFVGDFRFYVNIDDQNVISWGSREYQRSLTFDNTPTQNSNNPVKSGGVYSALATKMQRVVINMEENNGVLTFTDADNNALTHAQVRELLNSPQNYVILNYDDLSYPPSYSTWDDGYWKFERVTMESDRIITIGWNDGIYLDEIAYTLLTRDYLDYLVPTTRKINNKPLSSDITLNASDVNANIFVVNIEDDGNGVYNCDKTNAEIYAAWQAGRDIVLIKDTNYLYKLNTPPTQTTCEFGGDDSDDIGSYSHYLISTSNGQQKVRENYVYFQEHLQSGTNIKTINNQSLLGSGNISLQGEQGPAGTIAIGTVTDGTSASVTNSGTSSAAVLDFVLPRGAKGDKGDKGDTGESGVSLGEVVLEQSSGTSTTSVMSQNAVGNAIANSIATTTHLPVMGMETNGCTISSENYRKFLFDDIKYLDVSSRMYYKNIPNGYQFYYLGSLFRIAADANNYIAITNGGGGNYLYAVVVKNGTQIHKSANSNDTPGSLALINHNICFDFISKRIVFKRATRDGTVTITYTVDMSDWDLSGLEGKQVYFLKNFRSDGGYPVYVYTYVRVNDPASNEGIIAKTTPYSIQGSFPPMPFSSIINRSGGITAVNIGVEINAGITLLETISATHKKYRCSRTSTDYIGLHGSGASCYPKNAIIVSGIKFKLLDGTPTFYNGQATYYVIKPDGDFASISGFTFETNVEYILVCKAYKNYEGGSYNVYYGLRANGNFDFEIYDPFVLTPQKQVLSSDCVSNNVFTGPIPFSAENVSFIKYSPNQSVSSSYHYYHVGELKFSDDKIYMWTGTVWKQISNA